MARLLFILLTVSGCQSSDWQPLTVHEGKHAFKPYQVRWNDDILTIHEWRFDSTCIYNVGNNDQCDWNKLTGRTIHLLDNHKNTAMISWRWDLGGYFWIAPYIHKDGLTTWSNAPCTGYSWGNNDVLKAIKVRPNETLETTILANGYGISIKAKNLTTGKETKVYTDFNEYGYTREISPWFGGNLAAPHHMAISRKTIYRK